LIFDNVVPFVYLLFFVAQVRIHLVTGTIVVVLNIGIDARSHKPIRVVKGIKSDTNEENASSTVRNYLKKRDRNRNDSH